MMKKEELWGGIARSCIGERIVDIELVSICQMLRLVFENNTMIELTSCWRYRTSKSILIGSLDIGFFIKTVDSEEEINQFIEDQETYHNKKLRTLIGRTLKNIVFGESEISLELSGKRHIDWLCLSADELGFRAINNYNQR